MFALGAAAATWARAEAVRKQAEFNRALALVARHGSGWVARRNGRSTAILPSESRVPKIKKADA